MIGEPDAVTSPDEHRRSPNREMRWRKPLAWLVAALAFPAVVAPLVVVIPDEGVSLGLVVGWGVTTAILALALWLTIRVPDSAVAWTLLLTVAGAVTHQSALDFVDRAAGPAARITFGVATAIFPIQIVLGLVIFPLIFPSGRPPSHRWRWVLWLAVGGLLTQVARAAYLAATLPGGSLVDGPTGIGVFDGLVTIGQVAIAVAAIGALVSLGVRFSRSAGVERQQIKALLFPVTFLVLFWVADSINDESPVSLVFLLIGAVTLPIGLVVAITRHRLYDIDRVVSRTVTYTVVIGLLIAVYALAVVLLTQVLPVDSALAVAASTLAAAALFTPLRRRVQRVVDGRFNRTRYRSEKELEAFTGRLRGTTDIDRLYDDLEGVVHRTLQPASFGVWIRHSDAERHEGRTR